MLFHRGQAFRARKGMQILITCKVTWWQPGNHKKLMKGKWASLNPGKCSFLRTKRAILSNRVMRGKLFPLVTKIGWGRVNKSLLGKTNLNHIGEYCMKLPRFSITSKMSFIHRKLFKVTDSPRVKETQRKTYQAWGRVIILRIDLKEMSPHQPLE
jgi:hypothetical protein